MADVVDFTTRVVSKAEPEGHPERPLVWGSVHCSHCGGHACRLTYTIGLVPIGVRCFNCNGRFTDVGWHDILEQPDNDDTVQP